MQPRSASLPPRQLPLPLEIEAQQTNLSLPSQPKLMVETERPEGHCVPRKAWRTLSLPGQQRLRRTWIRVLKEVVDDA